jgi:recombination protein RecT
MPENKPAPGSNLALIKKDTIDVVANKVREFQERGEIHFPVNYSPENAMKAAFLELQKVVDKGKRPCLEVCTKNSIANALLDMVVMGLTPAKNQVYFIVYGTELVCQPSYFGRITVTKSATGAVDVVGQVVYEGDEFEYEIDARGRKRLLKHVQKLANIDKNKIVAAYCTIIWKDRDFMDIMTFDQIKAAWKKSPMHPIDDSGNVKAASTHGEFTADMALKTVMGHACKYYLNTSDDSNLVLDHWRAAEEAAAEAEIVEEIELNANQEIIDVEPVAIEAPAEPVEVDMETGEVVEAPAKVAGPDY